MDDPTKSYELTEKLFMSKIIETLFIHVLRLNCKAFLTVACARQFNLLMKLTSNRIGILIR